MIAARSMSMSAPWRRARVGRPQRLGPVSHARRQVAAPSAGSSPDVITVFSEGFARPRARRDQVRVGDQRGGAAIVDQVGELVGLGQRVDDRRPRHSP